MFDGDTFGFVDVAAEEMLRLVLLDEIAHGSGSGVKTGSDLVECRAVRRGVADQDERVQIGEGRKAVASSDSLYSPGVLKGVGLEYPSPAMW